MSVSRRLSREFLLQSLYARSELGNDFDRTRFTESFFQGDTPHAFESLYIDTLECNILEHESELLSLIQRLAPKFELATMPVLHLLILMISLTEMIYAIELDIPVSVSINEAIELAKRFSDDHGKVFINGALATFLKDRETLLTQASSVDMHIF